VEGLVNRRTSESGASPALRFDPGPDGLLQCFGSVTVLLEKTTGGPAMQEREPFTVGIGSLVEWLERYQRWFTEKAGVHEGHNLHRLYHREVLITGAGTAACPGAVLTVASAVRRLGLAFAWNLELHEALTCRDKVLKILHRGEVDALGLQIATSLDSFDSFSALRLLEEIAASRIRLGLIGDVQVLRRIGALECEAINAVGISIYPVRAGKRAEGPNYLPIQACASRFRLYVAADGLVYPCLGLMGLPQFAVANLNEQWERSVLAGVSYPLDLSWLSHSGPGLPLNIGEPPSSSLPLVCELHRMSLLLPATLDTPPTTTYKDG
jgi:hypothetical protein